MSGGSWNGQSHEWQERLSLSTRERDYWSRFTQRDTTNDGAVVKLDVVKTKAGNGYFVGTNFY